MNNIETKINKNTKLNKIKGSLFAGAIGDAIGYKIEFFDWNKIKLCYGEKGIQELPLIKDTAIISDDTQMTLFTCEGMLYAKEKDSDLIWTIHQAYLNWLKSQGIIRKRYNFTMHEETEILPEIESKLLKNPKLNVQRAPGNTCISALYSGQMGTLKSPINDSKGCGGVMRTAPLGFINARNKPLLAGSEVAALTHGHQGGWLPAGMLSDIIYKIIYTDKNIKEIIHQSLQETVQYWNTPYIYEFLAIMQKAINLSEKDMLDVEAIHSIGEGWVGDEALAIAIYSVLKHSDKIKDAILCAVNHKGDSDSTGAIAGNMIGAYLGFDAIPPEWIEHIEHREVLEEMAERMAEL
jgi:ADP-ribosylglycohydrolase